MSSPLSPSEIPDVEWIFGYGSLMWRPGFPFLEQHPARLEGYHRAACIYSRHHRGTAERPGLVLGLDQGGKCDGIAFRFDTNKRTEVIEYLNERELIGYAYKPVVEPIQINGFECKAYTYVADSSHSHYAGDLGIERAAAIILGAVGESGLNRDYLISTVAKLESEGFAEPELIELLNRVKILTGEIDQGGGI